MTHTSIPVCDIAALRSGSMREQAGVVLDIGAAARDIGFFTIVNHGIAHSLREQTFAAAERFFGLPALEKERVSMDDSPYFGGYARLGTGRSDSDLPADYKESFNIRRELAAHDADLMARPPFVALNRWPNLVGFRETALTYFEAMSRLAALIQRAFALDLGMAPNFFAPYTDRPLTTLRFLRYPPHPGRLDGTLYGAGAHNDWGIFTLLAQNDVDGLEVQRRDGTWVSVEPAPNSLICNVGDCLMRWSNDRYVSRPHRVVNRASQARYAIAFLADPNPDALIACLPSCQDEDQPPKYAPISYADYQQERYHATVMSAAI